MITATPSTALAMIQPPSPAPDGSPSPGFLAGYRAQTAIPGPRVMSKTGAWLRPGG